MDPLNLRALDIPGLGPVDLVAFVSSAPSLSPPSSSSAPSYTRLSFTPVRLPTPFLSPADFSFSGRSKPLNPNEWKEYPLKEKTQISPNTAIYRFKLPHPQDVLGLPTGQHISVSAEINGKIITRSYTPVSSDDHKGYFELLIKTYDKGNISRYVAQLKIGDNIRVKGPKGNFAYTPDLTTHISMIAGGTGITPMVQIIRAALRNPLDKTTLSLIYANVNEEDILLKKELDQLFAAHPSRFSLFYVLNNPPSGWTGGVGFVTKDHIKEYLPNPADANTKLLMCGPPPMIAAMKKNLDELKYPAPRTISKLDDKVISNNSICKTCPF
ncbi:hypothetical protein BDQ17DRAFT_1229400 [Cyathus striatus]|nr:hypothetical protein BDQ17DRAFT_1229400 [Cyathus striatus]